MAKRGRVKRWLKRIGVGLEGLAIIAALLLVDFVRSFQRSVPSYDGTLSVHTPNVTSVTLLHSDPQSPYPSVYEIAIAGETFTHGSHVTIVTSIDGTFLIPATYPALDGKLGVAFADLHGNVNVEQDFQFVVYKP